MLPWEFRQLTPEKKAELMGHWYAYREVDVYEKIESTRDLDKESKK